MKKKNLRPLILSSLAAMAMAGIGTGATFALFTDKAETAINVQAGKIDVNAVIQTPTLFSADPTLTSGDLAGVISSGEFAGTYYFKQMGSAFLNGGTAAVNENKLSIDKMTPGDKVTSTIDITNNSNVTTKYRVKFGCSDGIILFSSLKLTIGEEELTRIKSYESEWAVIDFAEKTVPISVELPLSAGNEYQGLSTEIYYIVEAVQGNAATSQGSKKEELELTASRKAVEAEVSNNQVVAKSAQFSIVENEGQEEKVTKVTFADEWYSAEGTDNSLDVVLAVETYGEEKAASSAADNAFTTHAGTSIVAGLDLNLSVNGETVTTFNDTRTKIENSIDAGLTNVKVFYGEEELDTVDEGNNDYFVYDSATGALTIYTTHFSQWYVTADTRDWVDVAATSYSLKDETNKIIEIASAKELALLDKEVNQTSDIYSGWTVKLTQDIDMGGRRWQPLGNSMSNNKRFAANLDGQNHVIKNLMCYEDETYGIGFIGDMANQNAISNVTFEGATVAHKIYTENHYGRGNIVGIVAGYAYGNVTFDNVHVKDSIVSGYGKVGGILGMAADSTGVTKFKNCSVEGTTVYGIYNMAYFAGLVQNRITFESCSFENSKFHAFDNVVVMEEGTITDHNIDISGSMYWNYDGKNYFSKYANYCNIYSWNKPMVSERLNNGAVDLDSWCINNLEFLDQYEETMFTAQ